MTRRSQVVAAAPPQPVVHRNHLVAALSLGSVVLPGQICFRNPYYGVLFGE